MRVADYIIHRLAEEGIRHLFMVTGRGILYLSDAAAKEPDIQCVSVHHEQAGAYAAAAYAQYNGKLGAVLVSTGCAATNAITGVLCAWQDDVPCVFISGQNSLNETVRHRKLPIRTFGQQEADIVSLVSPITKYAVMLEDPNQIVYEMDKALYLVRNGRKGPVWIDVPLDIQNMRIEPEKQQHYLPPQEKPRNMTAALTELYNDLCAAKRPVIMIGSGIRSADAVEEFRQFVQRWQLPVVYANSAVDVWCSNDPLSMGVVGTIGANRSANFAIQNADYVIVIGNRLNSMTVGIPEKFAREAKITIIDIDPVEHSKTIFKNSSFIQINARDFFQQMKKFVPATDISLWKKQCSHWQVRFPKCPGGRCGKSPMDLYEVLFTLSCFLRQKTVVICDAGLEELLVPSTISYQYGQRLIQPHSQGAMGYALPAGIGAFLASGTETVVITGDGSIMMNLQELQTIVFHQYPLKIIIINNDCYAVIRKRQQDLFRTRTIGTDPSNGISCPDFGKIAYAFGMHYIKCSNIQDVKNAFRNMMEINIPLICEIITDPFQTVLHSSFARSEDGCLVQRPLEDQSPYLDRKIFLDEMLIPPIDQ